MRRTGVVWGLIGLGVLVFSPAVGAQGQPGATTTTTTEVATTTTTVPVPAPCAAAAAAAAAGQKELAVRQYLAAAKVAATEACALAGLQALGPGEAAEDAPCAASKALLAAGNLTEARAGYVAVLKDAPTLGCAIEGMRLVAVAEVRANCTKGDELRAQGATDSAAKAYEAAVETGVNAGIDVSCGTEGLDAIREDKSTAAPATWGRAFEVIVKFVVTALWIAAIAIALVALAAFACGWSIRLWRRCRPNAHGISLVPRLRLEKVGMSDDGGSADGVTSLLRNELRSSQGAIPRLQVGDSAATTLVANVKELDAKLAAIAALAVELRRINPWPSLTVTTHQLKKATKGSGLALSIVHGGREPAATTFWRHPVDPKLPTIQQVYELLPAAAMWILVESALVTAVAGDARSPNQVASSGYVEAARRLDAEGDRASALRLYEEAVRADGSNLMAKLAIQNLDPHDKPIDERPKAVRDVLDSGFAGTWLHPQATGRLWGMDA